MVYAWFEGEIRRKVIQGRSGGRGFEKDEEMRECHPSIPTQTVDNGSEETAHAVNQRRCPILVNIIFRKTKHYLNRHGSRRLPCPTLHVDDYAKFIEQLVL